MFFTSETAINQMEAGPAMAVVTDGRVQLEEQMSDWKGFGRREEEEEQLLKTAEGKEGG